MSRAADPSVRQLVGKAADPRWSEQERSNARTLARAAGASVKQLVSKAAVKRFRRGLIFKAHRRLHHPTLGLRVIKKREEKKMLSFTVSRQGGCFFI